MGNWDDIYKRYQRGGDAWATLSEGIDPRFLSFLNEHTFPKKSALDIGCGTGKYLAFLEQHNFTVTGIDASPTAIEMTKAVASPRATIERGDMYKYSYPAATYGLILSISTAHHGYKEQITSLVKKIYDSLVTGGHVFLTLPNLASSESWKTFRDQTELAPGTYAPNTGPEAGLAHSFYTKPEIRKLFSKFQNLQLDLDEIGRWFITGNKPQEN